MYLFDVTILFTVFFPMFHRDVPTFSWTNTNQVDIFVKQMSYFSKQ